jgi:hypothetical protein
MPTDTNTRGRLIRRGQKAAARNMSRQLEQQAAELRQTYQAALNDIHTELSALTDSEGMIPIERLEQAERIADTRLRTLGRQTEALIDAGLNRSVSIGIGPWEGIEDIAPQQIAQNTAQFVREFRDENGLQLSDRLWRVNRGARETVIDAIEDNIVRGRNAHQAARDLLLRGQSVPGDLMDARTLATLDKIQQRTTEALLTGEGNPYYNAERVFRTEMNRAFGETAIQAAAEHPQVRAVRFTLSPNHPEPDICDLHAQANLHGLGPGVYPIDNHPWPAHPNTLSYLEPIFVDEITDEDRAGRETMTKFINDQPAAKQDAILGGKAKGWAWRQGHLSARQVRTPWKKLRPQLQRKGIDIPGRFAP